MFKHRRVLNSSTNRSGDRHLVLLLGLLLSVTGFWTLPRAQAQLSGPDLEITLESMGIEGFFKAGGYVPVRLSVQSRLNETTAVIVGFEVENSDGDTERYTRSMVLSPGQRNRVWLYPNLPPRALAADQRNQVYRVVVFEDEDGRPGRELAAAPVSARTALTPGVPVEMTEDLLVVVGSGSMGLDAYQSTLNQIPQVPSLNTRCIIGTVQPESLPDRARGLESVQTLLWSDASPTALGLDQAEAIKDWVRAGGRFVIVLPEGNDPWSIGSRTRTALSDLLPESAPRRIENVPISSLIQAISKEEPLRNPEARSSIRLFDADRLNEPWEPLAAIPGPRGESTAVTEPTDPLEGGLYAIQRRYGFGWIVVVGLDANALFRRQLQAGALPQADVFWNRLLARRGSLPPLELYPAYEADKIKRLDTREFALGRGNLVLEQISIGGAGVGTWLLVILIMFLLYGVGAGPLSFWWLKRKGWIRYSWLVFLGFTVLFTGIAVTAASIGRSFINARAPVRHLTFLDVIDGEPDARATSWFSAYLPEYGTADIAIEGSRSTLSTWSPPPSGSLETFPNSVTFEVDQTPNRLRLPARGTSTHLRATWQGPLGGSWQDMPTDAEVPVRQVVYPTDPPGFEIEGVIRHGLPWKFSRIRLLQIAPINNMLPRYTNIDLLSRELPISPLPNPGIFAGITPEDWNAGEAIDLRQLFPGRQQIRNAQLADSKLSLTRQMDEIYQRRILGQLENTILATTTDWTDFRQECLEMYAFFRMLPQPVYLLDQPGWKNSAPALRLNRWLGANTDCSDWLVRPCIMVIATLEGVPSPVPLRINGEEVASEGTVVLRWIRPLPVDARYVVTPTRTLQPLELGPPRDGE
ncbi:MAG: hypothetical protein VX641_06275 [Planctomycetota bacterium]|nr:hypothetical protein [Planctomycetota bacterium]